MAAVLGGIGASRQKAGRFFYETAIMGTELIEQAHLGICKPGRPRKGIQNLIVSPLLIA